MHTGAGFRAGPGVLRLTGLVVVVAGAVEHGELLRQPWAPVVLGGALVAVVIAAGVGWVIGTRAATAASTAATAASEERRRLGRELHDRVAQDLAGLALRVDGLAAAGPGVGSARIASELGSETRRILRELRRCITDLRADGLADVSLATAMADHARQAADAVGITAHLSLSEASRRLDVGTELELLRISQEAINNVRRHASARNLWVDLRIDPPSATLCVADDGIGPPRFSGGSHPGTGHGLSIMRERAQAIGAALAVTGRPGGGTQVDVSISAPTMARRARRQMGDGP